MHGADYFRRWHREKANSGGLLVHKASHHFDLVNWWIADEPQTVFALGRAAVLRGRGGRRARGRRPPGAQPRRSRPGADPFGIDLAADPRLRRLYLDAEAEDGYLRDRDVFTGGISIEDNMAVLVGYRGGAVLSYSLNAHAPWEGYRVAINGTAGRLELDVVERAAVAGNGARNAVDPSVIPDGADEGVRTVGSELVLQRHWEPARRVPIVADTGPHGGGDPLLLADLFRPDRPADPLGRAAGWVDGLRAVGVGVAANRSMVTGEPVRVDALLEVAR